VTDLVTPPTGADGRALRTRGARTRAKLLEAAESVFAQLGYHDASIVKITEAAGVAQGTFYLYFQSKKDVFEEVVLDLNRRVRHYVQEAAKDGRNRQEIEALGFRAYFRFTAEHPALYRVIRQAEFVSPETLYEHYARFTPGYVAGLEAAMTKGEIAKADPVVLTWALMGIAELFGMRSILWQQHGEIPEDELRELEAIIARALGSQ
jgi:AcrR family transcriptional regulator